MTGKSPAVSEPKLWRKSTFHIKRGGSKKAVAGSGSSLTSLETTRHPDEQEHLQDSQGDQSELSCFQWLSFLPFAEETTLVACSYICPAYKI